MPKNMLISLKNCKNRQTLWGAAVQTPISVILHCKFFFLHLPHKSQTLSKSTKIPNYFLVIILGVHQAFVVEKLCCILYATVTDYGNYSHRFQFFSFCLSHSFCAGAGLGKKVVDWDKAKTCSY